VTLNIIYSVALVSTKSESGPTMNAHEFIEYKLEIDRNNPYIRIEEESIAMLDGRDGVAMYESIIEELTMCKFVMWW
jgi:hypothetical protein